MQVVDEAFLSLGVDEASGISENQLTLLDIDHTYHDEWKAHALGKSISDARAELFVLLKGITAKTNQERIIKNYKALQGFRKGEQTQTSPSEVSETDAGDVVLYCDGGCSPNPGASGSGIALYRAGALSELYYGLYEPMGTNNTAELNALYQSLLLAQKESKRGNRVEIKCDSMYAINCIKTWAKSWEKNGWRRKDGEIKNLQIIQESYRLYNTLSHEVKLSHIKAHNGLEGNELADRMTHYSRKTKEKEFVRYSQKIDIPAILKWG